MPTIFNQQNLLRLGTEAVLIVFSLLLALIINEYRSNLKEEKLTQKYLERLGEELQSNQKIMEEMIPYHKVVLQNFRLANTNDSVKAEIYVDGKINLFKLAPKGLLQEYPSSVAWEVAKQSGLSRNFDFELLYLLSKTYKQQDMVMNKTVMKLVDKIYDPAINSVENQEETLYFFNLATNELYTQELSLLSLIKASLEKIESIEK